MLAPLTLNGTAIQADPSGALWWQAERTLIVSDLHLEKGSSFAERGTFLPPYDTRATLDVLAHLVRRHQPARVIALGDSFHDGRAGHRIPVSDAERVRRMTGDTDWVWITGNHDPEPPADLGGRMADVVTLGALTFRHLPTEGGAPGEVCGHLHPKARVTTRERTVSGRCFVTDGSRLVMPAFGAFAGGLDALDPAVRTLFRPRPYRVFLLGRDRLYVFPVSRLERREAA